MNTKQNIAKNKTVVTNPVAAASYLRNYLKNSSSSPTPIAGTKAKHATVAQVVEYYAAQGTNLDRGWLGRALNQSSNVTSVTFTSNGRTNTAYRILK